MKKTAAFVSLLFIFGLGYSQNCSPDSQYVAQGPGVYPDSITGLDPASTCQPYSAVITVVVPYDTVVNGTYMLIDSVVLISVDDLPPGFSHSCEPPSCSFPGGTAGCILISGFPDPADTGDYVPVGNVLGYVDAFPGNGVPFPKIDYYVIEILNSGGPVSATIVNSLPISCNGVCDGEIMAVPSCGYSPYSYLWSIGQTSQTITGLCAGNYSVTISDSLGNSTANFSLAQPGVLSLSFVKTAPNNGCNGSITVNPSGGTAPFSFNWNNGDTMQIINSLCGGAYQVTVSDARGCTAVNAVFLLVGTEEQFDVDLPGLLLYPNPNDGKFEVSSDNMVNSIEISNLLGEVVYASHPAANQFSVDGTSFSKGIYFVKVTVGESISIKKIIYQ